MAFTTPEAVQRAVSQLHKSVLSQHTIVVRPDFDTKKERKASDKSFVLAAREAMARVRTPAGSKEDDARSSSSSSSGGNQSLRGMVDNMSQSVFVGNLCSELTEMDLRKHFER